MKLKKFIVCTLAISLFSINYMPAFAFHSKKVIQSQVTEYKFKDVNLDWWKNYNDEYLEGYIVKAIDNNQDLKIATLKVEEARQNAKLQFSKELPSATIGASEFGFKVPGDTSGYSAFGLPIMVNYEADIFLKNHDKTKSVKKLHEISKLNEKAVYIAVASQVGATYFNIVRIDKLISIQNQIITQRKQIFNLMKQRNRQGITSTADATRAEKSYVMAVADLTDLEKARASLLNSLAVLTGDSPNNIREYKRISYDELFIKNPIPSSISSEIITQRPDYEAAEKQVEKAGLDVRIAKKEFLPTIDLLGLAMFSADSYMKLPINWTNAIGLLGGQAMLPIFTGGAKFANLRLNKTKYEEAIQNYYKTNIVAIQEVNDSLSALKFDTEKYQKNLKSYKMQRADYKYMENRYEQGIISNLDLLQQKETLLVMNEAVISSKTACFIDNIGVYKAVGGKI